MAFMNKLTSNAPEPDTTDRPPIVFIKPPSKWAAIDWRELYQYRELLYFSIWRDIKVRYKQTALGAAWAVIQPFMTMVVFSIFFGRLAGLPSEGVPYPIFTYTALVPWTYFANALTQSSSSLVEQERVITKVYFPRLLVPMAPVVAGLLDLFISFFVLILMMLTGRSSSDRKRINVAKISFFLPLLIGAVMLAYYNYARFGSFFELGHQYALSS